MALSPTMEGGARRVEFAQRRWVPLVGEPVRAIMTAANSGGTPLLSRYRIGEKLGAGGMGVVLRAEDISLKRPVALKFLSGKALSQEQTRARFLREAQTAAALNHPNVCTIYEVGEVQKGKEGALGSGLELEAGTPFIAMELIEGRTLEAMVRQSESRPLDDLLGIALQIADGMAAAHARGIVHRDLKPGNVMVTKEGRVKILDFGLAKPLEPAASTDAAGTAAATASAQLTREGRVVGTVAYMSPEQAKGEPVDSRSDVFSFGVMLYELTSGTRPFRGTTTISTLAKIIEAEPEPIPDSRSDIPQELRRIVRRCLQKKPEDRYNDTRDLVAALKALRQEATSGAPRIVSGEAVAPPRRSAVRSRFLWAAVAVGVLIVALVALLLVRTKDVRHSKAAPPTHQQVTHSGTASQPVLSPDGQFMAYVEGVPGTTAKLMVQDLAGGKPLAVFESKFLFSPQWSHDGTQLLFSALREDGSGFLTFVVPRLGGVARPVASRAGYLAWAPDGRRFALAGQEQHEITVTDLSTSATRTLAIDAPFEWIVGIDWSPTGGLFAVTTLQERRYVLWTVHAEGGRPIRVAEQDAFLSAPCFSPRGDALYYLSSQQGSDTTSFRKARIDPESGHPSGEAALILSGLESTSFAISRNGKRMLYTREGRQSNLWLMDANKSAASGWRSTQVTSGTSMDDAPAISPDGQAVAFLRRGTEGTNVFIRSLNDGALKQLTFGNAERFSPVWSPDGRQIAFGSTEGGTARIWRIGVEGGDARPFERSRPTSNGTLAWSPGTRILYTRPGNRNIMILDPSTEEETPLLRDESLGWVFGGVWSPDRTRVALFLRGAISVDSVDRGGAGVWVVSLDNSVRKRIYPDVQSLSFAPPIGWSADGLWVYVVSTPSAGTAGEASRPVVWRAPAKGGPAKKVTVLPPMAGGLPAEADVSLDGTRLIVAVSDTRTDVWLAENFDPELSRE